MNIQSADKYVINSSSTLILAMETIESNSVGLIYVVDADKRLVGCLTDGDIRRWILKNCNLTISVAEVMNTNPVYIYEDEIDKGISRMIDENVYSIAIVDRLNRLKNVAFLDSHMKMRVKRKRDVLKDIPVIIMAGGKGTRLYPYTKILPKPLIPVGDVPILERILDGFYDFGVTEFYLSVNFKKEMIKSYFAESEHPYKISYVEEDIPLGTAGSISLIDQKFNTPVIISNCDIYIVAEYSDILTHHVNSNNDMTIVSSLKNTVIPYGVLRTGNDGSVLSMDEKPVISHLINTGMYIINPDCLELIPHNRVFHMTDLANQMISLGMKVGVYPISERSFLDMGQMEELKKMEVRLAELQK